MADLVKNEFSSVGKNEATENKEQLKKEETEEMEVDQLQKQSFLDKFSQLWFACYFERRLTR